MTEQLDNHVKIQDHSGFHFNLTLRFSSSKFHFMSSEARRLCCFHFLPLLIDSIKFNKFVKKKIKVIFMACSQPIKSHRKFDLKAIKRKKIINM